MRDHGGNIDSAMARFGGAPSDWIDLSTGINRQPYPLPDIPPSLWQALPTRAAIDGLCDVARAAYGASGALLPVAGAQAAIQLIPRVLPQGDARVLGPTYNEHAASLRAAGWTVAEVTDSQALHGADLAVIVNPNNPDGRRFTPDEILQIAGGCRWLIVDESFADPCPGLSVADHTHRDGLIVLRSFGKFYGLAGLRLGFVLASEGTIAPLRDLSGPWPVSGPAIAVGQRALADVEWQAATTRRLTGEVTRMDQIAATAGWTHAGGAELFRLYRTPDATAARDRLARAHIWSRIFPWSPNLIRLGLPGDEAEWHRLTAALAP